MRRKVGSFLLRHRVHISMGTVLLYLLVILPASVALFPDSTLWLAMLLVFVGLMDEVKDLIDQIAEDEQDAQEREG